MGYTTWFHGQFNLDRPLTTAHRNYLQAFSEVRHMCWNAELLEHMEEDPRREAVGLPIGEEGRYFTGLAAMHGQYYEHPALASVSLSRMVPRPPSLIGIPEAELPFPFNIPPYPFSGSNVPPLGVPDLWCHWAPNTEGTAILWDGGKKFSSYIGWLRFLLEHFLIPWKYTLNGQVHWQGEQEEDKGNILVANNEINVEKMAAK